VIALTPTAGLFFDASCLFAAAASPQGGSAFLLDVCARGYLQAVVSSDILIEAERNIVEKHTHQTHSRYRHLLVSTSFVLVTTPPEEIVRQHEADFFEDAHVVASAVAAGVDYLITLDRALERRVQQTDLGLIALAPREFLQRLLPQHPAYARIRQQG
jgi:predicted nucleic acid-binding protein